MNKNIFRTYDIRGIADKDLTDDVVEMIGKAYGTYMIRKKKKTITVGRDIRLSSERIKNALVRGVLSTGVNVIDVGVVPTPVVYFSIVHYATDGSVMITGSHNPIEYNGLKMNNGLYSIYGDEVIKIRELIEKQDFESGDGSIENREIVSHYKQMLRERININKPFKIVIDAGNGTAGPIAPDMFEEFGCTVTRLYCDPDGTFPNHLPDPTVMKYIEKLRTTVVEEHADIGIGYDGDSDRMGIVDDRGKVIYADKLLAVLAREVLKKNPGSKIIFDVKCSQLVPEEIERMGGIPLMWKTGHSIIKEKMRNEQAPLAGEMSGHIFFKDGYFGYDDGIFSSFRLLQYLSKQKQTLGEIVDQLPQFYSTPEIRIACPDDKKFKIVEKLKEDFKKEHEVIDVDGARVLFGDGWGLVRVSNTQPLLVLRFEAKTEKRLKEMIALFKERLIKFPSVAVEEMDNI
ncbi:MAG: phosphomannomutase/phosphoglucomutase [bacterium]